MTDRPLTCTGRTFDRDGAPVEGKAGEPHGRQFALRQRHERQARYELRARMLGWRIGPVKPDGSQDVMCPECAKPDPDTAALCRDLKRSVRR